MSANPPLMLPEEKHEMQIKQIVIFFGRCRPSKYIGNTNFLMVHFAPSCSGEDPRERLLTPTPRPSSPSSFLDPKTENAWLVILVRRLGAGFLLRPDPPGSWKEASLGGWHAVTTFLLLLLMLLIFFYQST